MLFNSFEFLYFFILVTSLYFLLPHRYRWLLLLISSCYFYMRFVPVYILILAGTIIIDYFAGILLESPDRKNRKLILGISLMANIGILAVFKYYNFLCQNFNLLLHSLNSGEQLPYLNILLPIGLSFHTFQAMSYTIEVYRGNHKAERHFGIYALYVMFYPQLVAGPIERPQNILYQFYEKHEFDYKRVTDGVKLMVWGLIKKIVVADRLSVVVSHVFDNPDGHTGYSIIIATIFFSFQIYCDFSGYTDIAIGAAKVIGFKLMKNFNNPYNSRSVSEFWSKWHISLSTWFRDYLYIPLGGNRVTVPRWYMNLFIVFLISGLWHGANWTYIVWGALHGVYLIIGLITLKFRQQLIRKLNIAHLKRVFSILEILFTFFLVAFAWVFFRAKDMTTALALIKNSTYDLKISWHQLSQISITDYLGQTKGDFLLSICSIIILQCLLNLQSKKSLLTWINNQSTTLRWSIYSTAVFVIIFFVQSSSGQFIYFQF
jgi:alginate O-acetyltransferase complex protein AlgI